MSNLGKTIGITSALMITGMLAIGQQVEGEKQGTVPKGWHLLDKSKDGYSGISLGKAYEFVKSKNLKGKPVIVAVIDSGIDTLHEDLKEVLWKNPKEIPGNGIDDDGNGYVDDVYGWNFLGNKDGRNLKQDSYEGARVYHAYKAKFEKVDPTTLSGDEAITYKMWAKAKAKVEGDGNSGADLFMLKTALKNAEKSDSVIRAGMKKDVYTGNELDTFTATTQAEKAAKGGFLYLFRANKMMETTNKEFIEGFSEYVNGESKKAEAKDHAPEDLRGAVTGDNEKDINDKYYGNSDVMASTPFHGTHVAGIIGAVRGNGKGMDGVADNVRIMAVRAVPDGDEHDKDIALAIRYAVDNGAQIINMSFGKDYSPNKKWVDEAVQYANSKGVLLVHAAGNDSKDVDVQDNFPSPVYQSGSGKADNWITVGASGDEAAGGLTASFSNYGKKEVDVFAPGVKIYSTIPGGNTYGDAQGTSMASPVVAGAAAFLKSYFPKLSPKQLKYCIEKSVQAPTGQVRKPGTDEMVPMSDLAKNGGVINVYEAAKIAATLQGGAVPEKKKTTVKPTMKNKKG
ncbi:S8 family serine peptidase [Pseudoflavitalea sp. G-6-1-2]|uniref:S8 family peptidase n=1 Tax=Pseudoflavitalea sp. G-6-1-2 TaxID=2728841 RepID=UPI00146EA857|nr:S8 family peptidase [Pseudoflavitalea sp. G-6-1-2]NML23912.1 S8 family serine peptidase [Pseudoflavitalea sp. G-6-1-2]